jgi:ATP-dependent RNA helicase RhlE
VLVLEEADRMIGLGLAVELRKLLKLLPETRQTLMFTMTMPPELNRLAKEALVEPVRVDLAPVGKSGTGITQAIYPVPRDLKSDLLTELLSRQEVRNTVLFARARAGSERYTRHLARRGYTVAMLDEHPNQSSRESMLDDLRRGKLQVLVSSDVVARSLDLTGIAHVINADVPQTPEDYVHRLGRVGAPEAVGDVFTLMSPEEQKNVAAIERLVGRAIPRVLLPDFDYNMHPTEFQQVVSYGDEPPLTRRVAGGLQLAAARIATSPRAAGGKNGAPARAPLAPRPTPPGKPASHVRPAPAPSSDRKSQPAKAPVAVSRPSKPVPRPAKSAARPGKRVAKTAERRH